MKFYFRLLFVLLLLMLNRPSYAQFDSKRMEQWQDSLHTLGQAMFNLRGEAERIDKNFSFVKTLVLALKEKHAYNFDFEQLNMISIIRAPDDRFRIFSWNIPLNDGSYLYYGAIQTKTKDGHLSLVPLLDKTFEIEQTANAVLTSDNWYGAQYYEIVALGKDSYVLLGWKGHHATYSQKVIEPLQYNGEHFSFGLSVFSEDAQQTRKIFSYGRQLNMYLKYHQDLNRIVFDHIVPVDPALTGQYQHYGPDLSFDAYQLSAGKLEHKSNVTFKNEGLVDERDQTRPGEAIRNKKSGL